MITDIIDDIDRSRAIKLVDRGSIAKRKLNNY